LQYLSTKDMYNERNLSQDLSTIENTDAADFPLKNFSKLAKRVETIRSYQKLGWIGSDEGLTLETSAFESLHGGPSFALSTQLIKPNDLIKDWLWL